LISTDIYFGVAINAPGFKQGIFGKADRAKKKESMVHGING